MFMSYVNIGLACMVAGGVYVADLSAQAKPDAQSQTTKPAPQTQTAKPAGQTETAKPAGQTQTAKPAGQTQTAKPAGQSQTSKPAMEGQSSSTQAGGTVNLGTVRIPRAVKVGNESLSAGSYQVRVTETPAQPPAAGQTPQYERWAEFMRGGKVVAREVVTIVPASDMKQVAEMTPPPSGGSRTDVLKGNEYLRLWINRGGNHYLIHFNL
jgi:hypothetical protein